MSDALINCPISKFARETPDKIAVISKDGTFTYSELDQKIIDMGDQLSLKGYLKGDVISVSEFDKLSSTIIIWACFRKGITVFPVNPKFSNSFIDELTYISKARTVTLELYIKSNSDSRTTELKTISKEYHATYVLTSGSTGRPKIAVLSFLNYFENYNKSKSLLKLNSKSNYLLSLPLYHVSGLSILFRVFFSGASLVIDNSGSLSELVGKYKITHLSLVQTQAQVLLEKAEEFELSSLRCVLLGGSIIHPDVVSNCLKNELPILISYGLTETASQCRTRNPFDGNYLEMASLRIKNDEVQVKGDVLFQGYITDKGFLSLPLTYDGYFQTKDLARINSDGCLDVYARKDNMFISGGENVYPEEIEAAIFSLKGIENVVVVPIKDDCYQYRPVAFVYSDIDSNKLMSYIQLNLKDYLPSYKIPKKIYKWPDSLKSNDLKPKRSDFVKFL